MFQQFFIRPYLLLFLLISVICVVFLPVIELPFSLMDTITYVLTNKAIHDLSLESISYICFKPMIYFMPVTWFSHMIDYFLFNTYAAGHHFTNLLIHIFNVVLVTFFSHFTLKRYFKKSSSYTLFIISILIALIWGIHPLRVESVAWIANRKGLCVSFFSLLSCIFYYFLNNRFDYKYLLFIILFFLALCSHPYAVPLPMIFIFLDWLNEPNENISFFKYFLSRIYFYLPLFLLSSWVSFLTIKEHYSIQAVESDILSTSLIQLVLGAFGRCFFYINKTILPIELLPIYPFMKPNIISISSIFGIFVIYSLFSTRFPKPYKVSMMTFIVFLLPVMGFIQSGFFSHGDRWSYLSTLPFYILIAGYLYKLFSIKRKKIFHISFISIFTLYFLFFTSQTRNFIHTWSSYDIFYQRCFDAFPNKSPYVLDGIVTVNIMQKKFDKALEIAHLMNKLFPNQIISNEALVRVHFAQGDFNKTSTLLSKINNQKNASLTDLLMLAQSYYAINDYQNALKTCKKIIKSSTYSSYLNSQVYFQALNLTADIYHKRDEKDKAGIYYHRAFNFDPLSLSIVKQYSDFLYNSQRYREALYITEKFYINSLKSFSSLLMYSSMCIDVSKKIADENLLNKGLKLQSELNMHLNNQMVN